MESPSLLACGHSEAKELEGEIMATARRVVTGVNSAGKSIVISDEVLPERTDGVASIPIYSTPAPATVPVRDMPSKLIATNRPPYFGTSWQIIEFPVTKGGGMHTTDGLDYIVIRSGEITMTMEDGSETVLKEGDYLVQGGVAHAWSNRSGKPCIAECFVIGVPRAVD